MSRNGLSRNSFEESDFFCETPNAVEELALKSKRKVALFVFAFYIWCHGWNLELGFGA